WLHLRVWLPTRHRLVPNECFRRDNSALHQLSKIDVRYRPSWLARVDIMPVHLFSLRHRALRSRSSRARDSQSLFSCFALDHLVNYWTGCGGNVVAAGSSHRTPLRRCASTLAEKVLKSRPIGTN